MDTTASAMSSSDPTSTAPVDRIAALEAALAA
jgi:hypothetical protein